MNYGEDPTEDMWNDYDHNQNTGELDDLFEEQTYTENKEYSNNPPAGNYNSQAGNGCMILIFFFLSLWLVV